MKIVLAYSGGLDTSIMIKWLKENYNAEVIAAIVDVGQTDDDLLKVKQKAIKTGASKAYLIDAKKEFVEKYIFQAIKANAIYEGKYYLGTSLARPIIAEKIIDIAKKEKADAVAHGATGKGNDQVRFELTFKALMPSIKIIAPWREWELKSRQEEIEYAKEHDIPIPVSKEKPYSSDANIWHISYEGGILENLENAPNESMFQMTVSPEEAPNKATIIDIYFEKGVPKKINGKKYSSVELVEKLNELGGKNGVGRSDVVENRLVGMKSRGVYESPAAVILYTSHREIEALVLDRETAHFKDILSQRYSEIVYYGLWQSQLKKAIDGFINETQKNVTGLVKLKLYKGNCIIMGRISPKSLYWEKLSTFEEEDIYNQKDAEGFINLFGLPLKVEAILRRKAG
ncbi:MAG: argininosuccinate synthase [Elusimicrobia bacterium RIFOXYC2_FULL_34_12]|nr:MAG: argininosuccinate synthase [Elusimicrobia bacterium RIFOXYC2_FULL_34_12]OGS38417.1 MAG: argininosuccinate synthase [Elusimicrobia bacterium RIFOXYD2_FULL_34_30]HAM39606.1 argininosuccinate synthase [Elusimicrobiota bacterium]